MNGVYETIVNNNCFKVPEELRNFLTDEIMPVCIGNHINLYRKEDFDIKEKAVESLKISSKKNRQIRRIFLGGAEPEHKYKDGIVTIRKYRINELGINGLCYIFINGDHLEVWDQEIYEQIYGQQEENLRKL